MRLVSDVSVGARFGQYPNDCRDERRTREALHKAGGHFGGAVQPVVAS